MKKTVLLSALLLLIGMTANAAITIDGSFADWTGVTPSFSDPSGDHDPGGGSPATSDAITLSAATDGTNLYIYIQTDPASTAGIWDADFHNNIFIDTDQNAATGFNVNGLGVVGSELLMQSGAGFDERGGGFNEGGVTTLNYTTAGDGSNQVEISIDLSATYGDASAVFPNGANVDIIITSDDSGFATDELCPDAAGLTLPVELSVFTVE